MSDTFLTPEEIAILTGRKFKRLQIEQLRKMGIPFWVNAVNMPIRRPRDDRGAQGEGRAAETQMGAERPEGKMTRAKSTVSAQSASIPGSYVQKIGFEVLNMFV